MDCKITRLYAVRGYLCTESEKVVTSIIRGFPPSSKKKKKSQSAQSCSAAGYILQTSITPI